MVRCRLFTSASMRIATSNLRFRYPAYRMGTAEPAMSRTQRYFIDIDPQCDAATRVEIRCRLRRRRAQVEFYPPVGYNMCTRLERRTASNESQCEGTIADVRISSFSRQLRVFNIPKQEG